jgi:hypothetical protein
MQYQNPSHPLDLNIHAYEVIRGEFEKFREHARAMNLSEEGISIEQFSQFLSLKLHIQPKRLVKMLLRALYKRIITWNDFQQLLDRESCVREDVLDWVMFEIPCKHFKL